MKHLNVNTLEVNHADFLTIFFSFCPKKCRKMDIVSWVWVSIFLSFGALEFFTMRTKKACLKELLTWHWTLQGPSNSPSLLLPKLQRYEDTVRCVALQRYHQVRNVLAENTLFTLILDCKKTTKQNWVSDQTCNLPEQPQRVLCHGWLRQTKTSRQL